MLESFQEQGALFFVGFSFFFLVAVWSLNRLQHSLPSPVNKALVRWVRLLLIAGFIGILAKVAFLPEMAFWRLALIAGLAWVALESLYLWIYIVAWDKSDLPLFPRIKPVDKVDWPANRRFFLIRDWIREHDYSEIGCFRYFYADEVLQSVVLFESPDRKIRLQVIIVADPSGVILDQVVFSSMLDDGRRAITDNIFMPFGGVYPEDWKVRRYPWARDIGRLGAFHERSISEEEGNALELDEDPLEWIQESQFSLERENVRHGILNMASDRDDHGKMTGEGRYRIWKELLVLNYFARSGG